MLIKYIMESKGEFRLKFRRGHNLKLMDQTLQAVPGGKVIQLNIYEKGYRRGLNH
jgi:hypothetical protein